MLEETEHKGSPTTLLTANDCKCLILLESAICRLLNHFLNTTTIQIQKNS